MLLYSDETVLPVNLDCLFRTPKIFVVDKETMEYVHSGGTSGCDSVTDPHRDRVNHHLYII